MDLGKIKGIKYVSPIADGSGYARASRDYILSLNKLGVPLTISPVSFEKARPDFGENTDVLKSLINKKIDYNVVLIHLTPEHIPIFKEQGKTNINYTVWETTKIHQDWNRYLDMADGVLLPCEWNKEVFQNSGVQKPIGIVPHGLDCGIFDNKEKLEINGIKEDDYVFYSVFQWTARKNPLGLLRAFYSAFAGRNDVVLLLKTYLSDYSDQGRDFIMRSITSLKNNITSKEIFPRVALVHELLSDESLVKLNNRGDCYISLAHSEGWGLGYFHAMAAGKPTIGTGGTGNTAFMDKNNSFLVNYTWSPTVGMPHFVWYTSDQYWAEPDLKHAIETMRYVEKNRVEANKIGLQAAEDIREKYNWGVIANTMVSEINTIIG